MRVVRCIALEGGAVRDHIRQFDTLDEALKHCTDHINAAHEIPRKRYNRRERERLVNQ